MTDLNVAQREALLASAKKHEEAAGEIREISERLKAGGYHLYANELAGVVIHMIRHVDTARDLARKKS